MTIPAPVCDCGTRKENPPHPVGRMNGMHPCDVCGAEYPSDLAASYCCDPDETKDR